eukprot:TRINITY_DN901_c0_g1_i6.p1 TRINITY_DN901_c0_g1~~TRINITY_DN901_c0_g1_i6.p1  ORF type:complete len:301 (-),score=89.39 TRINITY_DN901_c0_g1_i6:793-1695(-)
MWARAYKEAEMATKERKPEAFGKVEKSTDSTVPGPEIWGLEVLGDALDAERTGLQKKEMGTKSRPQRPQYTHFVAVQIKTESIKERMGVFQEQFKKFERDSWAAEVPTSKAHVTLRMMALPTEEDIARAKNAIEALGKSLSAEYPDGLNITLESISSFSKKVLFANPISTDDLKRFQDLCSRGLVMDGMEDKSGMAGGDEFHVTLFKQSAARHAKKHKKRTDFTTIDLNAKRFLEREVSEAEDAGEDSDWLKTLHFGTEHCQTIQLCRLKPRKEHQEELKMTKYYDIESEYDFVSQRWMK